MAVASAAAALFESRVLRARCASTSTYPGWPNRMPEISRDARDLFLTGLYPSPWRRFAPRGGLAHSSCAGLTLASRARPRPGSWWVAALAPREPNLAAIWGRRTRLRKARRAGPARCRLPYLVRGQVAASGSPRCAAGRPELRSVLLLPSVSYANYSLDKHLAQ